MITLEKAFANVLNFNFSVFGSQHQKCYSLESIMNYGPFIQNSVYHNRFASPLSGQREARELI